MRVRGQAERKAVVELTYAGVLSRLPGLITKRSNIKKQLSHTAKTEPRWRNDGKTGRELSKGWWDGVYNFEVLQN